MHVFTIEARMSEMFFYTQCNLILSSTHISLMFVHDYEPCHKLLKCWCSTKKSDHIRPTYLYTKLSLCWFCWTTTWWHLCGPQESMNVSVWERHANACEIGFNSWYLPCGLWQNLFSPSLLLIPKMAWNIILFMFYNVSLCFWPMLVWYCLSCFDMIGVSIMVISKFPITNKVRRFVGIFVFNTIQVYIPCKNLHVGANHPSNNTIYNGVDPNNKVFFSLWQTHQISTFDWYYRCDYRWDG